MTLYLLKAHDGIERHLFAELEMPTIGSLRSEAVRCACDHVANGRTRLWSDGDWGMDVTTRKGTVLFSLFITAVDAAAMVG